MTALLTGFYQTQIENSTGVDSSTKLRRRSSRRSKQVIWSEIHRPLLSSSELRRDLQSSCTAPLTLFLRLAQKQCCLDAENNAARTTVWIDNPTFHPHRNRKCQCPRSACSTRPTTGNNYAYGLLSDAFLLVYRQQSLDLTMAFSLALVTSDLDLYMRRYAPLSYLRFLPPARLWPIAP